ncbi:MAG: methyltransferase family protein [Bacteroidota bacterium]
MALIHTFESSGNTLFRYRGQIPLLLFAASVPVIWLTDITCITEDMYWVLLAVCGFVSFLGFIIRAIAIGTTPKNTSGRNTKEQVADTVNQTGIYSTVRHPLYLGNYFMWIGIVGFTFNIWFVLVVTLAYWLYYERIMFAEERFLEKKFGEVYISWSMKVPAFIPSFKNYKKSVVPFSMKSVLRREYSGILATVFGFLFVALCRDYFMMETFEFNMNYAWILGGTLVFTFILRSLKKYTSVLNEEGRW